MQEFADEGVELTTEEKNFLPSLKPAHFLLFTTGATDTPTFGFDPFPTLSFVHDDMKKISTAQTCLNMLYLYVNKYTVENSIAHQLLIALINGGVFSKL